MPLLVAGSRWGVLPRQPPPLVGNRIKRGPRELLPRRTHPSRARRSERP